MSQRTQFVVGAVAVISLLAVLIVALVVVFATEAEEDGGGPSWPG